MYISCERVEVEGILLHTPNPHKHQTMRPQHHLLLASAAVVAPQSPSTLLFCVSAFSSSSIRSSSSKSSRKTSLLRWTEDKEASSQEALLLSEEVVDDIQYKDNLGRSTPSSTHRPSMSEAASAHGMPWTTSTGRTEEVDPLLYMPFWTWQLDYMKSTLTNLHPIDCTTSTTGLDVSYNENTDKRARIVNHCYASDEYSKIRMTYYDAGDSVQVFNSVWYPDAKYNLPVLGIDLLSFNRKRYLAIVDFQPIHPNEEDHACTFEDRLRPIKDKYDNLKGRMSSKFYDETQFFSKEMLFARFEDGTIVNKDLFPAFTSYVTTHVDMVKTTPPATDIHDIQHVLDRQTAYDTYSAERDPAAGLFASMFGKTWAEDFIYDFLFSRSERKEGGLNLTPPTFGAPQPSPPPQAVVGNPHHAAVSPPPLHHVQQHSSSSSSSSSTHVVTAAQRHHFGVPSTPPLTSSSEKMVVRRL